MKLHIGNRKKIVWKSAKCKNSHGFIIFTERWRITFEVKPHETPSTGSDAQSSPQQSFFPKTLKMYFYKKNSLSEHTNH